MSDGRAAAAGPAGAPARAGLRWRWIAVVTGALASVLLGGCIYLRLLELRSQLANFDRYFETDLRSGVKITCQKPVLLDADMAFFKLVPESRTRAGVAERWRFRWVKVSSSPGEDPRDYEVAVDFIFVDHKLTRVLLPERLFVFVPKQFFLTVVKAFGHAQIDQQKRTASASVHEEFGPDKLPPQLTRTDLTAMLGAPLEIKENAAGVIWHYQYRAASADQRSGHIDITFTLNPASQKVRRIQGRVFDLTLDIALPDSTAGAPPANNSAAHDAHP
ncbi:MAG TPA: hypothetical protein VLW52_17265 [Opitutaceae bacterium]|nr:hypothetical protein [Opitutaceae bacterium]